VRDSKIWPTAAFQNPRTSQESNDLFKKKKKKKKQAKFLRVEPFQSSVWNHPPPVTPKFGSTKDIGYRHAKKGQDGSKSGEG
jgi:hypothetical protein